VYDCDEGEAPFGDFPAPEKGFGRIDSVSISEVKLDSLRCIIQRSRPRHVSGRQDALPFKNANDMQSLFGRLRLPRAYFQMCDGFMTTIFAHVNRDQSGRAESYEFAAHCIAKQGDWALAMTHDLRTRSTSAFLSMDARINSDDIVNDLHDFGSSAAHPMLIPCIMLSNTLRLAISRRRSLKERLQWLEDSLKSIDRKGTLNHEVDFSNDEYETTQQDLESFFKVLESCRKDQESRKGMYEFWGSYKAAIENGFAYAKENMDDNTNDGYFRIHQDLEKWAIVISNRLQSLKARDKDHIIRVDNASFMVSYTSVSIIAFTQSSQLYKLIQQRDMRLQSGIARASQRDSEDMKFIAVLGSVFLPAGLVAVS
jgi:hypothetical protein